MKKLYWLLSIVIISVVFFQCQKELHFIGSSDTGVSVMPDPIKASLQGNITDENDQPAAGVMVTAGASTTITDDKGYFRFTDASLDKNTTLVTAAKDGYFKGYRVFAATSGCNQVVIKLIKKDLAGTVAAATGGEVALSNGSKISLPASGIVTASSNSNYSGDVKVYASYINPANTDISKTIPGSLVANNKDGKRVVLASYGMLAVELSSASGEKLQIKSGSVATLTIPIPSSSVASAPATIPLWYVDETTGIWQEEGTATKQGNNYVGDVKHFSFWNCDYPFDAVKLSLTLQTPSGAPLIYSQVQIIATSTSDTGSSVSSAYGYTDSLGQVEGIVPANKELTIKVLGSCYSVVYSQTVQPLTQNKDLGIIKITDDTHLLVEFTGLIEACNGAPVTNGYALISFNGIVQYAPTEASGKFTATYISCSSFSATATVIGANNDDQQQGDPYTLDINSSLIDAGILTACGVSNEEYINYKLDGTDYSINNQENGDSTFFDRDSAVNGYQLNGITYIDCFATDNSGNRISFTVLNANTAGTYPINSLFAQSQDSTTLSQPFNAVFTKFAAAAGDYYEGSLSGTYTQQGTSHTVSATFRAQRNY